MTKIFRYLKLYLSILKVSLMVTLTNRADLLVWTGVHAFELLIYLVFFQAIFLRSTTLGGWNAYEVIILLGYMEVILGLGGMTIYPIMYGFSKMIQKGELDWKLVKPVDIQFITTFSWLDTTDLMSIITGLVLMAFGVYKLGPANIIFNLIIFIVLFISSMMILYSIILLLVSLAFKSTSMNSVDSLFWNFQMLGRYPISVFKGVTYFIFMFVIPLGLISSVPARVLAGVIVPEQIFVSIVMSISLFYISRKVFLSNIRGYSSASS